MQKDLKRLVAYSSVAHLGFIVLGTFAFTTQGLQGGVLQMVNHGISTGALFLLVGMIYERRHTREIAELGGLQKAAPLLAGVFIVVMLQLGRRCPASTASSASSWSSSAPSSTRRGGPWWPPPA